VASWKLVYKRGGERCFKLLLVRGRGKKDSVLSANASEFLADVSQEGGE